MKFFTAILLILSAAACLAQAPEAAPYLAKVAKYNEASNFEDVRYKDIDWKQFYKLEEANEFVDPFNYDFDLMNAAVFFAINKYRASKNIAPLYFEPRLRDAATIHTYQMVKRNFFDHMNYSDSKIQDPEKRIHLCGYTGQKLAENLSRTYVDKAKPMTYTQVADRVVDELSKSRDHNRHMLDPDLEKLGCALIFETVSTPEGVTYFRLTQDFARDWK